MVVIYRIICRQGPIYYHRWSYTEKDFFQWKKLLLSGYHPSGGYSPYPQPNGMYPQHQLYGPPGYNGGPHHEYSNYDGGYINPYVGGSHHPDGRPVGEETMMWNEAQHQGGYYDERGAWQDLYDPQGYFY